MTSSPRPGSSRHGPPAAPRSTSSAPAAAASAPSTWAASTCAADLDPGWTPDGRRITFTPVIGPFDQVNDSARSAVLHPAKLDGSGIRRLSEPGIDGAFEDYRARFAPGGRYLIFVRSATATSSRPCSGCAPDGTHVHQLTPWRLDADTSDLSATQRRRPPSRLALATVRVPARLGSRSLTLKA
jgi:hypothetical protein